MKKTLCLVLCLALLSVVCPVFFTEEAVACEGGSEDWYTENGYELKTFDDYFLAVKAGEATLVEYNG